MVTSNQSVMTMFKIGNSKELRAIPDHISEEGNNFVRHCLQRNPANRPTAAQLLEYPFVKNAAQFVRPDPGTKAMETEALFSSASGIRTLVCTLCYNYHFLAGSHSSVIWSFATYMFSGLSNRF
ncbi:mitogen-activated protein kinase kinase kinase YODA [Cryptomeria japonica]|uniref:mitogen-activated protein kinase kinase kinase YODA n=1 Tax=Cryptomeria japonica TaxID=3369 RepID=UPI0027DAA6DC|nr:mitogen-activated protein kinase kinase kinase YODA [Cryptomeria japonica]XP_057835971.2 mitogen-activated protein kinase kinase kinase YODA [Cryptomeria japonica]XP_057835972.2 mitogen-activated protein kinase kinase kinase YODA [Cryptomeria japonica]